LESDGIGILDRQVLPGYVLTEGLAVFLPEGGITE